MAGERVAYPADLLGAGRFGACAGRGSGMSYASDSPPLPTGASAGRPRSRSRSRHRERSPVVAGVQRRELEEYRATRRGLAQAPRVAWWETVLVAALRTVERGDWQACNLCGVSVTRDSYTSAQRKKPATMRLCRVCAVMQQMSPVDVAQAYEKIDPTTVFARWPLDCDTMVAKLLIFQEERARAA